MRGKFTTLSYGAGNPHTTETIFVNGICFNAFANLGHALRQARYFWKNNFDKQELLLWADQVCINQSNPEERSQQVNLMGDIYRSAEHALICLSVEGNVPGGIAWLHQLSHTFATELQPTDILHSKWEDKSFHLGWDAFLRTFLGSPWWSRAWVRQEFIRSPDAYFLAVYESMHWKEAVDIVGLKMLDVYYSHKDWHAFDSSRPATPNRSGPSEESSDSCQACILGSNPNIFWEVGRRADRLLKAKVKAASGPVQHLDLLDNLRDIPFCKASDPRDLIYAFLGLSEHSYGLYPDYSLNITLPDVLIQLARNIISHDKNLNFLDMTCRTHHEKMDPNVPSWVPDWRNMPRFQACRDIVKDQKTRTSTSISFLPNEKGRQGRILQVRGVCRDVLISEMEAWPRQFLSATGDKIPVLGMVGVNDEVWMLDGANILLILRRQGHYHRLVGEVLVNISELSKIDFLADETTRLVAKNDATVRLINIC